MVNIPNVTKCRRTTAAPGNRLKVCILAAGELAKTYFMDVLTFNGWYDYYADSLLGDFYEWFYGGMVTPTKHYAIFQGRRGQIVSPGTEVTFITEEQEPQCRLDGLVVDALSRAPGRVTVHVPPGTHEIEFDEVGGLD